MKYDDRIQRYESKVRMSDGKGPAVSIDPGTRVYREIGGQDTFSWWLKDVQEAFDGELIPYEWVSDYVGVTRAALSLRAKKGQITVLVYEHAERVKGILGGERSRMRKEYKYIPKTECDSWKRDLMERL